MWRKICPLLSDNANNVGCDPTSCAWYNEKEQMCEMVLVSRTLLEIKDHLDSLELSQP